MAVLDPRSGSWYVLHDYISLFFYTVDTPTIITTDGDTGDTWLSINTGKDPYNFPLDVPTGSGGVSHQIAQQFLVRDGWTKEAQSQWVSHAVDPSYFKYLARETLTTSDPGWYVYHIGTTSGPVFGLSSYSTVTFDSCIWVRDPTGKMYRSNFTIYTGRYTTPYMTGGTPGNSVKKSASSTEYGITNAGACYGGSGWDSPSKGTDDYITLYETAYLPRYYLSRGGNVSVNQASFSVQDILTNAIPWIPNDDPYGDNPDPKDGGGDGGREDWGDTVGDDPAPTLDLASLGMASAYAPTAAQLKSFSQYLWSDAFSVDTLKKIFSDPFQSIITVHALPFAVTAGGDASVVFGNIASDVTMRTLAAQYYDIDCGSVSIPEYWGSFFDYSPYTTYQIYLPYVGYKEIKPEDFVTGTISVHYIIDAWTGAFTAKLLSSAVNGSALYQYTGNMAYQIPLSKSDYSAIISNVLSSAAALGGGIAALAATGSAAALGGAAMSTVGKVTSSKINVQRSGNIGGAAGWYASQTPYLIRVRPNPVLASNQNYYIGRPSYKTYMLSQLSGYTKVKDIRLSGVTGTEAEKSEIESLLKEGVIF